jgi:hypothetical protein
VRYSKGYKENRPILQLESIVLSQFVFATDHAAESLPLKASCRTEENTLPTRKQNLFSVPQKKTEASIFEETWLLHLAEIDDTITAGAKED